MGKLVVFKDGIPGERRISYTYFYRLGNADDYIQADSDIRWL